MLAYWVPRAFPGAYIESQTIRPLRSHSHSDWVRGDLFEGLDDAAFSRLDRYEGCEYLRELAQITLPDGSTLAAYIYRYALTVEGLEHLPEGDWLA